jgi:hypothetical protein
MCDMESLGSSLGFVLQTVPVSNAVGLVLAHDITEIRRGEFKGRAFKKGHVVRAEDVCHLLRLGKEHLYVLGLSPEQMHEDDAAHLLAEALMGDGLRMAGSPKEGKISIVADRDGLLKVNKEALYRFNEVGEVMCATLHNNTVVSRGQAVAATRAIPLVIARAVVEQAVAIANSSGKIIEVRQMRRPRAGIVITGNEVFHGRVKDAFAPLIIEKIRSVGGDIVGLHYAPDDQDVITDRLRRLIATGADLLITTGGMSVDPDDVTRFAIRRLGAVDITYGSAALPGAMFLIGYLDVKGRDVAGSNGSAAPLQTIPVMGVPACGMYARATVFDLVLPRVLAGERIGRRELAELGHGGLCLKCKECRYPACSFGK